mmetsp:Transcript_20033/g.44574  ORF Transcript_20033/g.44574 Transcript_20033/m.44574 type:complete len:149 (-) Transcript_20033:10-456(-)
MNFTRSAIDPSCVFGTVCQVSQLQSSLGDLVKSTPAAGLLERRSQMEPYDRDWWQRLEPYDDDFWQDARLVHDNNGPSQSARSGEWLTTTVKPVRSAADAADYDGYDWHDASLAHKKWSVGRLSLRELLETALDVRMGRESSESLCGF